MRKDDHDVTKKWYINRKIVYVLWEVEIFPRFFVLNLVLWRLLQSRLRNEIGAHGHSSVRRYPLSGTAPPIIKHVNFLAGNLLSAIFIYTFSREIKYIFQQCHANILSHQLIPKLIIHKHFQNWYQSTFWWLLQRRFPFIEILWHFDCST